jgi:cellulose synthase/poly-beta-1,6-N-acetylglucosamine synthase-like glycosyltransferase
MHYLEVTLVVAYFCVLSTLCLFGLHRAWLFYLCLRHKGAVESARIAEKRFREADLPSVTIQLPLYNEATVAARLIDAVGAIDYPRDRLEIQVLDDSSDETQSIARRRVEMLKDRGIRAEYVRRPDRHGYKAGALEYGLSRSKGELVAIFDADFIPRPGFLREIVHHFTDNEVAMVQTRWAHLNRDDNLMTGLQALMLDGHHLVENRARFGAGCYFNFAGTGGMWRKSAITAAGGWQHDTLTEDLDLSYRAQMAGQRFVYRPDITTPSELPDTMTALRAQQYRWAKGTVQTARKLLPLLFRHNSTMHQKIEGMFHMIPHFAYPFMLVMTVLMLPALLLLPPSDMRTLMLVDLPISFVATGSLAFFYGLAELTQGRSVWNVAKQLPMLMGLGAGLSPHLTKAVWSGLRSMNGEFVRTPKRGDGLSRYRAAAQLPYVEAALCLLSVASAVVAVRLGHYFAAPFALIFAWGYGYVATQVVRETLPVSGASRAGASLPAEAEEEPLAKAA